MGTGFREFPQTPRGRGFSLLGFILRLSTMLMFRLCEALNCHLTGSKPWNRFLLDFETHEHSVLVLRTVWVKCVMNCSINHVLIWMRPGMTVKCEFTK